MKIKKLILSVENFKKYEPKISESLCSIVKFSQTKTAQPKLKKPVLQKNM